MTIDVYGYNEQFPVMDQIYRKKYFLSDRATRKNCGTDLKPLRSSFGGLVFLFQNRKPRIDECKNTMC